MLQFSLSKNAWPPWAVLGIGLLATAFASFAVKQRLEQDAVRQFAFACDQVTLKIQERLGSYALILRGAAALFAASKEVSRDEWRNYVETLRAGGSVPGVQGIGFAQIIQPSELAAHTARIRAEGFPDYAVRPAGKRAVYTSIIYLEPFRDRNLRAFGFDMFSEPVRRAAMEQARDTGEAALSGKVQLVQETATQVQAGTLMYVPVYRSGAPVDTVERRRAALIGWAYSPYRMNDLMTGILNDWANREGKTVDLNIFDGPQITAGALLFSSDPEYAPNVRSLFYQQRPIAFTGHMWQLAFDNTLEAAGVGYKSAWATLIGGVTLSGLLFGLMLSLRTRTRMEDQVRELAFHDVLTKLPNRRLLDDRLGQAMAGNRRSGCYGALIFLDLDNFKLLNDRYGHAVGDLLLIEVAARLKSCVREVDTVARFGGDEFVVMARELNVDESASTAQAGIIAEKIRAALAKPYVLQIRHEGEAETTVEHHCTASIGVVLFSKHDASQEDILKWADTAMYQAKEAGRNLIQFYASQASVTARVA